MDLVGSHEKTGRWREGVKRRKEQKKKKNERLTRKRARARRERGKVRKVKETARMKPAAFSAGLARWGPARATVGAVLYRYDYQMGIRSRHSVLRTNSQLFTVRFHGCSRRLSGVFPWFDGEIFDFVSSL